ncbi:hypothetical protein ACET3Z_032298 [Daucus carota]
MGFDQSPNPPDHLYSQALQLKLYQAFIFSIPILFSIILFLLFYLFYLKKRASTFAHSPPVLPRTLTQPPPFIISVCEVGLKEELKEKLSTIVFDEELRARDSLCCVCLGEFEMKEELMQVPLCKHVFHRDCIRNWLRSNTTCPLCRCSVFVVDSTKRVLPPPPQTSPAQLPPTPLQSDSQIQANLAD